MYVYISELIFNFFNLKEKNPSILSLQFHSFANITYLLQIEKVIKHVINKRFFLLYKFK